MRHSRRARTFRPDARTTSMLLVAAVGTTLLLASCSGGANSDPAPAANEASGGGAASSDVAEDGAGTRSGERPGDVDLAVVREARRDVVHTARVVLHADDVEQAVRDATSVVDGAGGFLFSQEAELDDDPVVTATYKVPPQSFDAILDDLGGLGEVAGRDVDSEDVGGQLVDLEARLAAARTSAERLRALLGEAGDVADLLEVERVLAERDADVEALAAHLTDLEARVELATITLTVTPPDEPAEEAGEQDPAGFVSALADGWDAFLAAAGGIIVVVGYALPFLVAATLAALAAFTMVRRRRRTAPTG